MRKNIYAFASACIVLAAVSCTNGTGSSAGKDSFLITGNMDSAVKPGDNFFLFANGSWLKKAQIPAIESSVGSFSDLINKTRTNLRSILDSVSRGGQAAGSIEQKVGDFYASGMDSAAIEKRGYEPLKPYLAQIDAIKDAKGVLQFIATQQLEGNGIILGQYIGADDKNSRMNIAGYGQAGLGMPDRDYYFKTDAATAATVQAYQQYMKKLFTLTGDDSTAAAAKTATVFAFEKQIAASHKTNVELRDPESNYHKMAVKDLDKSMPVLGWASLLPAVGVKVDSVNVGQPAYYAKINELLKTAPIETWKTYLRFHVINGAANELSSDFVNASFAYNGKALRGQQQIKPRWQRMANNTDAYLGEALGQLYVKRFFTDSAKKRMQQLVTNLQTSFEARIARLDWMSDSTKQKATDKLHAFLKKIGYPDKWRDYSKVTIQRGQYFENLVACSKNEYEYQLGKVGQPVDKTEWGMTPPTINAYYNPTFNEIVFPAGILQFPFFDAAADDAINYGGIGMVIGHEMTHGFDDQGAQYDKDGNLKNWWSKEDYTRFKAKSKQVIDLYNSFTILDSVHVNGSLTTGENMADIGGIAIAYDAFKMTAQGKDTTKIDGYTPDQRFFLSLAQIWRSKQKEESMRLRINTDPHSPAEFRVNGPLMNFGPFYQAFNVQPGQKMYKSEAERIKIW